MPYCTGPRGEVSRSIRRQKEGRRKYELEPFLGFSEGMDEAEHMC